MCAFAYACVYMLCVVYMYVSVVDEYLSILIHVFACIPNFICYTYILFIRPDITRIH